MTGKCLQGRYLLGEVIGTGGMAVVYKGHDLRTGKTVAVKVLRPEFNDDAEFVARFEREAQAASLISHENLIDLYDVGVHEGTHFIVMEYVDGLTLKQLIERQGSLDTYTTISIARQICLALKLVHDAKIIHRDIKSQNILLDRKGIAKLADFGIARAADSNTVTQTTEKGVLGSVHYFSPEQARGERVSHQSDLYSLGVVLFEMATGKVPYDGETPVTVALHHLSSPIPSARSINPRTTKAIDEIIHKAMQKNPVDRYQDAQAMYNDLCLALVYPEGGFTDQSEETKPTVPKSAEAEPAKPSEAAVSTPAESKPAPVAPAKQSDLKKHHRSIRHIVTALIIVLSLSAIGIVLIILFEQNMLPGWVKSPQVVGLQYESAVQRLTSMELNISVSSYRYDDSIAPGIIIEQSPGKGMPLMRRSGKVEVVVCRGPEAPVTPSIVGLPQEQAVEAIQAAGLVVGEITRDETSKESRGTVLAQDPVPSTILANGDAVNITVSAPPMLKEVPDLYKLPLADAQKLLADSGFEMGEIEYERMAGVPVDAITRQSPEANATLADGGRVNVWVSMPFASYKYTATIPIEEDNTSVRIYLEDKNETKVIYDEKRNAGTTQVELNLESETEGEKTITIYINETVYNRETVYFSEEYA